MNLRTLKKRAASLGLVVEDDREAGTLYVETRPGWCISNETGLHYLAELHDNDPEWRKEAIAAMHERLEDAEVSRCEATECDWCDPGPGPEDHPEADGYTRRP